MRGRYGSFFDAFDEWNDEFDYSGADNMDNVVQAANALARSCICLLHPSGTRFIYKPRTHVNFGSPGKDESVEPAVVDAAGRNEAVPNIKLWGIKGASVASNTGDQSVVREGVVQCSDHVRHGGNN